MWHAEFKLHLYPVIPDLKINSNELRAILKRLQLISQKLAANRYSTGDSFLSHLTFMGCSPDIELEPQDDKPYCYIEVESHLEPQFVSGLNLKKAKCTACKENISTPLLCPHCKTLLNPAKINWRKTAFFASCWITIGNIYELEAIPNDQFLDTLDTETGVKWKPAYIRHKHF